jgi:hypothetical protein
MPVADGFPDLDVMPILSNGNGLSPNMWDFLDFQLPEDTGKEKLAMAGDIDGDMGVTHALYQSQSNNVSGTQLTHESSSFLGNKLTLGPATTPRVLTLWPSRPADRFPGVGSRPRPMASCQCPLG